MGTTATEQPKTRSKLARMAGIGAGFAGLDPRRACSSATPRSGSCSGRRRRLPAPPGLDDRPDRRAGTSSGPAAASSSACCSSSPTFWPATWPDGWRGGGGSSTASASSSAAWWSAAVIVGVVKAVTTPKDVKAITDALADFGIPTTREEWRHVDSVLPIASLVGMFLGSVLGAVAGERWYTEDLPPGAAGRGRRDRCPRAPLPHRRRRRQRAQQRERQRCRAPVGRRRRRRHRRPHQGRALRAGPGAATSRAGRR